MWLKFFSIAEQDCRQGLSDDYLLILCRHLWSRNSSHVLSIVLIPCLDAILLKTWRQFVCSLTSNHQQGRRCCKSSHVCRNAEGLFKQCRMKRETADQAETVLIFDTACSLNEQPDIYSTCIPNCKLRFAPQAMLHHKQPHRQAFARASTGPRTWPRIRVAEAPHGIQQHVGM